ncbi:MAG TPA: Ig-like domain-containing protein [Gemmatimonadales bacterium]|jgi:hypothetical protein|nr:Ig-like domain-containing protein [Gemmatimonadales bacterium]
MHPCRSLALVALAAASACGGDAGVTNPPPPPGPQPVATVEVSGPTEAVPGGEIQLVATLLDAAGEEVPDRPITWSSVSEAIATVSQTGLVTAVSTGTVTIRATSEGRTGGRSIRVLDGALVGPEGGTVTAFGGTLRLEVPAGAVSGPTSLTFNRPSSLPADPSVVPGSGATIGPAETSFDIPVRLTLRYAPSQGPSGVPESDFRVHRLEGVTPQDLGGEVDADADEATAEVTQLGTFLVGRAAPATPCTEPEHRQFDFWVGEWMVQVAQPPGAPPVPSDITMEPSGCAIFENFANGAGRSINLYSPLDDNWHQTFFFSNGSRQVLVGGLQGSEMILTGPAQGPPGSFDRWTWTPLGDGRVRQLQEQSNDGGVTVLPFFDGTYAPR